MLQFVDVSLRRGSRLLFERASFSIASGHKIGVVGGNGVGKSSLFSLIMNRLDSDSGEVVLTSDPVIASVAQETPTVEKPAVEYVIDGDMELRRLQSQLETAEANKDGQNQAALHDRLDAIDAYSAKSRAGKLMAGLGFTSDQETVSVSEFSGGWRMRLKLAQALMCRSDLLLLDEPTNHLDLDAVIWLQDWLSSYQGMLLLISHDREFLDSVVACILHLHQQRVTLYSGNYSKFEELRAQSLALQRSQYKKQQAEINQIRRFVDRFRVKATKSRQVQSRIKTLKKLELIASAHVDSPFNFCFREPVKLPNSIVTMKDVDAGYGANVILEGVDLTILAGDRIGLLGNNGAGKSTLIKLLAGEQEPLAGKRMMAESCEIGYFAQHQLEQLDEAATALDHLRRLDPGSSEANLRGYLGGFGFSGERSLQSAKTFSGGEKARLVLAMIVYKRPNLLLLDEPTNHLDMEMRHALSMALQNFAGAVVIVSHDRHLLRTVVDQFFLITEGCAEPFSGDLNDYRRWLSEQRLFTKPISSVSSKSQSGKDRRRVDAEIRKQLTPLRSALNRAEKEIAELDHETKRLEQLLSDPMLYIESEKRALKQILMEKAQIDRRVNEVEAEWMSATEALERAEKSLQETKRC